MNRRVILTLGVMFTATNNCYADALQEAYDAGYSAGYEKGRADGLTILGGVSTSKAGSVALSNPEPSSTIMVFPESQMTTMGDVTTATGGAMISGPESVVTDIQERLGGEVLGSGAISLPSDPVGEPAAR